MERVKLYCSKNDEEWEDFGTGYIRFHDTEDSDTTGFCLFSEEEEKELLKHEIGVNGTDYTLQEDNRIIRWTEHESNKALSFENEDYCKEVFKKFQKAMGESEIKIPDLTLSSLASVTKTLEETLPLLKEQLISQAPNLIPQLVDVFHKCEDLEDEEGLENCCRLARSLVLQSDFTTAELLFSDDHAMSIIGALEYDPDLAVRIKHRQFLQEKVAFKEVIPISDSSIVKKIHQIYRMQYVKDVVVPRLIDEPVFSVLTHLIMMGQIDVVSALSVDTSFFKKLFKKVDEVESRSQEMRDIVGFLQEFCMLLNQIQPNYRRSVLQQMQKLGMFNVLTDILREGCDSVKLKAIDILSYSMSQDSMAVRDHIVETTDHPLLRILAENLVKGDRMGLTGHSLEVIKAMLEPNDDHASKFESFLEMFYQKFISYFMEALSVGLKPEDKIQSDLPQQVSARAKEAVLDLLGFCVQNHTYSVKYWILRVNILEHVVDLLKAKEKWLVASAVRFVRTLVGMTEDFYDRILVRNDTLGKIVLLYIKSGDRNNLLNSSMLELFEFIRRERRHVHIEHIIDKYYPQLEDITYVDTFDKLKTEYDKKKEPSQEEEESVSITMSKTPSRYKRDARGLEKEEEDYFAESGEDTEKSQGSEMDIDGEDISEEHRAPKKLRAETPSVAFQREEEQRT